MRVVATLLVRDEQEIVRECIEHHLRHGVDGFIVTDNGSKDDTRKIVKSCPGILEVIDEPTHNHHQSKWVTRMARHAHRNGAYWVVHIDADEFWYGLEVLQDEHQLRGVGVITVKKEWVHVPVAGLEFGNFTRAQMPYCKRVKNPMPKVIHRAGEKVTITHGNHLAFGAPGRKVMAPRDIRIHHYPVRSYAHFVAKTIKGGKALKRHPGSVSNGKRWRNWYTAYKAGRLEAVYAEKLYNAERLRESIAAGSLRIHDTARLT